MAAQFFSSLADNALLVAAIALLMQADAPSWLTPYLKFFFVISYVLLAPYAGAFVASVFSGWAGRVRRQGEPPRVAVGITRVMRCSTLQALYADSRNVELSGTMTDRQSCHAQ